MKIRNRFKGALNIITNVLTIIFVIALLLAIYSYFFYYITIPTRIFDVTNVYKNTVTIGNLGTNTLNEFSALLEGRQVPVYVECPTNVIFDDNFDDGDANGWTPVNGNWYVFNKVYRGDSRASGTAESFVNLNFNYSTVTFDFKIGSRANVDVIMITDRSGSMLGQKIADAKTAAKTFVSQFNPSKDMAGLVSFNESATLNQPLTFDQNLVKSKIDSLVAAGYTNIGDAIYSATNELRKNGRVESSWVEILLTDGLPNRPLNENYGTQYALNASKNASYYNIPIYTIGLGSDANATLLGEIANNTGGKYYFAPDSSTLVQIYNQIAGEILAGGTAGIILKKDGTNLTKITVINDLNRIEITDSNGNVVGSGTYTIQNNTVYAMKVVSSGSKIFVNIDGNDIATGDIGSTEMKNKLSLFSSINLASFDNVKVTDNNVYPQQNCIANLFNFTSTPGSYEVVLRSPTHSQKVIITIT